MNPPYSFVRLYQYQTPASAPAKQRIRRVRIPDSQDWLGAVNGVLEILGNREYWRDNLTGGIDISTATFVGRVIFQDYMASDGFMIGTIVAAATQFRPPYTIPCDGAAYNRVDYPALYDVLDPIYITDADHFVTPDLRRRVPVGVGGDYVIGTIIGAESITLTSAQMPSHTHTIAPHSHSEIAATPTPINGGLEAPAIASQPTPAITGATALVTDSSGSGESIDIRNPAIALTYYIYAE